MDSGSARNMILVRLPTEILELILLPELSGRTIGPHESPLVGQDPNFRNFWKATWKRRLVCRRFNEAIFPVLLQKLGRQGLGLLLRTIVIDGNYHHMGWDAICKVTYQQHLRMTELLCKWRLNHAQRVSFLCNMYFAISDPRDDRFIPAREIWERTDQEVEALVLGAFNGWCNRFRVRTNQSGNEMLRHREELKRAGWNSQLIKEENARHEREIYRINKDIISLGPDAWFLDAQLAECNHFWHQENPLCCKTVFFAILCWSNLYPTSCFQNKDRRRKATTSQVAMSAQYYPPPPSGGQQNYPPPPQSPPAGQTKFSYPAPPSQPQRGHSGSYPPPPQPSPGQSQNYPPPPITSPTSQNFPPPKSSTPQNYPLPPQSSAVQAAKYPPPSQPSPSQGRSYPLPPQANSSPSQAQPQYPPPPGLVQQQAQQPQQQPSPQPSPQHQQYQQAQLPLRNSGSQDGASQFSAPPPSFDGPPDAAALPEKQFVEETPVDTSNPANLQGGVMVAMSHSVTLRGQIKFSMKKLVAGAELSSSTFVGPGELLLAPPMLGDITSLRLTGKETWSVGQDAYIASTQGVIKDYKRQGLSKAIFSGEGLYVYKMSGTGLLWLTSFGAIIRKDLMEGEKYVVDNGHLVAWNVKYIMERVASGGIISGISSGEGLVCKFTGPGTVFMQTRNAKHFFAYLNGQQHQSV
ncbi:duf124 domain-containing protein [Colletotrichum karsti]|uniref:Altered inheritance of mitochondria protein 24, mitochondrial n=1 Tax=Colletotrichum karsti TaxID=1095194 RepID=A0A9P6IGM0_9PEZI|nr:duf124 domain-containing protein [Colletotrichum karsti]KAF9882127.1 duf124 domain-containing protein [Colletotrichum karsti]